jgi:hypothetical protein
MGCGLAMMARLRDNHEEEACDSRLMTVHVSHIVSYFVVVFIHEKQGYSA